MAGKHLSFLVSLKTAYACANGSVSFLIDYLCLRCNVLTVNRDILNLTAQILFIFCFFLYKNSNSKYY